ncbi:MAG: hypothetical protein P4L33_15940 [Capsulimonadaceae bacterium]|nr:hypothetical protein [Capsulimonadaceae bacterium]
MAIDAAVTKPGGPGGKLDDIETARERAEGASNDGGIQFEDGFSWKVVAGAFFVGLIMMPGAIYLGLVAGASLGQASQWVTIVLFSEVARRSFMPLKKQEIYCIYYMAGALTYTGFSAGLPGISGGPFGSFIALQYLMQAPAMANVAPYLTTRGWIAPPLGSNAYIHRLFFDSAWALPVVILICNQIFDRMKWMGLGFILFRITSDVERLPFPMAPIAASGATALSEANTKEESWRWRIFSVGSIIGLVWGFFYLAIPIFTGVVMAKPVTLFPIPFIDLVPSTERSMPTALVGYNPDLGVLMMGFILPFQIVLGAIISSIMFQVIGNPILHAHGFFPDWRPGSTTIPTQIALNFDFWMSFGIGIQLAIAAVGLASVAKALFFSNKSTEKFQRASLTTINKARGDFPWIAAIGAWLCATCFYVMLNHKLVPEFPIFIIIFYGLVWTPLNSYISARMVGLTGSPVTFPFLNQAVVLKSGYSHPDIWFAPLPLNDYGGQAQKFREIELTGTKFTSIVKLELLMLPLILITSFLYWGFLWHTTDIPSAQFPFAQKMWPLSAVQSSIWTQINAVGGKGAWVLKALKPSLIAYGGLFGLVLYFITVLLKWPLLFYYGFMGGINNIPHNTVPTFIGAMLSRYYFAKRLGRERWQMYAPVVIAGFACGTGLVAMFGIALALIAKTINYLPF